MPTTGERGQASVELVALLPLALLLVAVAWQAAVAGQAVWLSGGAARELADHAAEAGAVALLEDADPRDAARGALPGWARDRLDVHVAGAAVRVRLHPPAMVPGLGALLDARAEAHAGEVRR